MNQYIGQQFAALRYEKNILVVEETTSAGGCGSFNAASSCPAPAVEPPWVMRDCVGNVSAIKNGKLLWPGRRNKLSKNKET